MADTLLKLFNLGRRGINVVDKPQDLDYAELITAQNAEILPAGEGLSQRLGMSKINAIALGGGSVVLLHDIPANLDSDFTPYLYAGYYTGGTHTWRRSADGITWSDVDTPAVPFSNNSNLGYFVRMPEAVTVNRKLYFFDGNASIGLHSFDGTTDRVESTIPPTVIGVNLATPGAPTVTYAGTTGTTTYTYKVVTIGNGGSYSAASSAASYTTGKSSLDGADFTIITPASPPADGAVRYDVYRTAGGATQGKIGSIPISAGAFTTGNGSGYGYVPSGTITETLQNGGLVEVGTHQYATTFVTASGETLPATTSSVTTVAGTTPSTPTFTSATGASWGLTPGGSYQVKIAFSRDTNYPPTTPTALSAAASFTADVNGNAFMTWTTPADGTLVQTVYYLSRDGGASFHLIGRYAFVNPSGTYYSCGANSNADIDAGSAPPTIDLTAQRQVALSSIPAGPTGTTSRKVYRTVAGGTQLKLLTTLADNTTTTYTDTTADASLGTNAPTSDTSGLANSNIFTDQGLAGDSASAPSSPSGTSAASAIGVIDTITDGSTIYAAVLDKKGTDPTYNGRILSYSPVSAGWSQVGDAFPTGSGNGTAGSLAFYDGALNYGTYIGTTNGNTAYITSTAMPLPAGGVPEVHTTSASIAPTVIVGFQGNFYAATSSLVAGTAALVLKRVPLGTWSTSLTAGGTAVLNAYTALFTFNNTLFTSWASGDGSAATTISSTTDGTNWTVEKTLATTDVVGQAVTFNGNLYVVCGKTGASFNTTWKILKRTPGGTWSTVDTPSDALAGCLGIVYV